MKISEILKIQNVKLYYHRRVFYTDNIINEKIRIQSYIDISHPKKFKTLGHLHPQQQKASTPGPHPQLDQSRTHIKPYNN